MKFKTAFVAALSAALLLPGIRLAAQSPAPTSSGGVLVAVVDVNKLFENHTGFQQRLKQLENDVKAYDAHLAAERANLEKQGEQLQNLRPGSPEYRQLEEDLAKKVSDLKVQAQLKKNDIVEREAKEYYQAYVQILAAVDEVSARHGISLVLRYDSQDIDPSDRTSVLRGVNRSVVLQRNLDITSLVIERLNPATARNNTLGPPVSPLRQR